MVVLFIFCTAGCVDLYRLPREQLWPLTPQGKSGSEPESYVLEEPCLNLMCVSCVMDPFKFELCMRLRRYFTPKSCGTLKCSKESLALYKTEEGRGLASSFPAVRILALKA